MRGPGKTSALRSVPGGGQLLAAVLCLAAAASAWGDTHSLFRAPLGFILTGLLPGWLLAQFLLRHKTVTLEEWGAAAALLSVPLAIVARVAAGALGASGISFVVAWALMCAAASLLIPRPGARRSPPDPAAWVIAFGFAAAVVFPAAVNPSIRSWGDAMFHAQVVQQILPRTLPTEDPAYFGMPLAYNWVFHIYVAALVDAMGLAPYEVFCWVNGAMMAALSLAMYRLASLYWPRLLYRRLAPAVLALGMNALGWLVFAARSVLSPFVGEQRGIVEVKEAFDLMLGNPTANTVTGALIYKAPYPLSSFLFKYLGANAMGAALSLVVAGFVFASLFLQEGGRGRLAAFGVVVVSAAIIHPLAGVPGACGFLVGFLMARIAQSVRRRIVQAAAVVALTLVFAAPVVALMSGEGLSVNEKVTFNLSSCNVSALIQGLLVVIVPGLWGWRELRRRQAALASFGAGFGLTAVVAAITVDFPERCELYVVYLAYLAVAFFATGGVAAFVSTLHRRAHGVLAWGLAGLLFLPSPILLIQGFARDSRGPGSHGYPEATAEIAVFDYLRDQSPPDAVVLDSKVSHHPACSAYSHRCAFYGGYLWAEIVGYPEEEMKRRERAVVNLFFESNVSDSTWSILNAISRPVYVIARSEFPQTTKLRGLPEEPVVNASTKLERFSHLFKPVLTTPTIVLFRYEGGAYEAGADEARACDGSRLKNESTVVQ